MKLLIIQLKRPIHQIQSHQPKGSSSDAHCRACTTLINRLRLQMEPSHRWVGLYQEGPPA